MSESVFFATPVGYVQVVAKDNQVVELVFENSVASPTVADLSKPLTPSTLSTHDSETQVLQKAQSELEDYFLGQQQRFSFAWNLYRQGTTFQQSVWQVISEIPYGQVMSYKEIAETIGKPRAYRAVANACGKNPLPIIVPCHRVVGSGSNGKYTLGGYSSGLDRKRALMKIEKISL